MNVLEPTTLHGSSTLRRYEERRNRERMAIFDSTCQLASLGPPSPDTLQLLAAIRGDGPAINRFVSLIAGTESFEKFFAPENLAGLLATKGRRDGAELTRGDEER